MSNPPYLARSVASLLLFALVASDITLAQAPTSAPSLNEGDKAPTAAQPGSFNPQDLIGEWDGYLMDGDGSKPSQRSGNVTLVITADKISTKIQGNQGEGTYRVSAGDGNFHNIDATGTAGHYDGKHYPGIFTLEGDTLKWCSGENGYPRPKTLFTNFPGGQYLMILTRKR